VLITSAGWTKFATVDARINFRCSIQVTARNGSSTDLPEVFILGRNLPSITHIERWLEKLGKRTKHHFQNNFGPTVREYCRLADRVAATKTKLGDFLKSLEEGNLRSYGYDGKIPHPTISLRSRHEG